MYIWFIFKLEFSNDLWRKCSSKKLSFCFLVNIQFIYLLDYAWLISFRGIFGYEILSLDIYLQFCYSFHKYVSKLSLLFQNNDFAVEWCSWSYVINCWDINLFIVSRDDVINVRLFSLIFRVKLVKPNDKYDSFTTTTFSVLLRSLSCDDYLVFIIAVIYLSTIYPFVMQQ